MLSTCYQGIIAPWDYNIPFSDSYIKGLNNIELYREKENGCLIQIERFSETLAAQHCLGPFRRTFRADAASLKVFTLKAGYEPRI